MSVDSSLCRGLVDLYRYNMKRYITLSFRRLFRQCRGDPMEVNKFDTLEDLMPSPIMSIEPQIEHTVTLLTE